MTAMLDSFPGHPKPRNLAVGYLFELVPRSYFLAGQSYPRVTPLPFEGKPPHSTAVFAVDQHSADSIKLLGIKQSNPGVPVRFFAATEDVLAVQQELGLSPESTACQNDASESFHGRLISRIACYSVGRDVGLSRAMRYNDITTEGELINPNPDLGWQAKKRGLLLVGPNSVSVSVVSKTFPASLLT
jgi:hypothetical protein